MVYSSQPMSQMQTLVAELFSRVPNRRLGRLSYGRAPPAFTESQLGILRRVKTVAKASKLTLTWILPAYQDQFDSNPVGILEFLVGHEGRGSLLSLLLARDLALDLTTWHINVANYFTSLTVEIELTRKGLRLHRTVVELVFAYVRVLTEKGLAKDLFDQIRLINDLEYKFKSKTDQLNKAITTASLLSKYPPELVNRVSFMYDRFDPEGFRELLRLIVPENLLVVLQSHDFEGLSQKDPIFGTSFEDAPLSPSLLDTLRGILAGGSAPECPV